jgi:hypothetical protein
VFAILRGKFGIRWRERFGENKKKEKDELFERNDKNGK